MSKIKALSQSYEWVDDIASKVIVELKKTADMLEEMHNGFFSQFGISNTKFNVLVILYKGPREGMMLSEIGEQMLVTKGNITGLIDRLEKQGLVHRTRDELDRRKIMAVITEKGRRFTEEVIEHYKIWTKEIMLGLASQEKSKVIHLLKKMQQRLMELESQ